MTFFDLGGIVIRNDVLDKIEVAVTLRYDGNKIILNCYDGKRMLFDVNAKNESFLNLVRGRILDYVVAEKIAKPNIVFKDITALKYFYYTKNKIVIGYKDLHLQLKTTLSPEAYDVSTILDDNFIKIHTGYFSKAFLRNVNIVYINKHIDYELTFVVVNNDRTETFFMPVDSVDIGLEELKKVVFREYDWCSEFIRIDKLSNIKLVKYEDISMKQDGSIPVIMIMYNDEPIYLSWGKDNESNLSKSYNRLRARLIGEYA